MHQSFGSIVQFTSAFHPQRGLLVNNLFACSMGDKEAARSSTPLGRVMKLTQGDAAPLWVICTWTPTWRNAPGPLGHRFQVNPWCEQSQKGEPLCLFCHRGDVKGSLLWMFGDSISYAVPHCLFFLRTMGRMRTSSMGLNDHLFFLQPLATVGRLSFGMSSQAACTASWIHWDPLMEQKIAKVGKGQALWPLCTGPSKCGLLASCLKDPQFWNGWIQV